MGSVCFLRRAGVLILLLGLDTMLSPSGTGRIIPPKITFKCDCGKRYRVPATKAGKRVRCKKCRNQIRIPDPIAEFDIGALESGTGESRKISIRTRKAILQELGINASAAEQEYEEKKRLDGYMCTMCSTRIPEELLKASYSEHGLMCDECRAAQVTQRELGCPIENERKKRAEAPQLDKWSTSPVAKTAALKANGLAALIFVGITGLLWVFGLTLWIGAPIALTIGVLAGRAFYKNTYVPDPEDE